jgi:hypothetical protein
MRVRNFAVIVWVLATLTVLMLLVGVLNGDTLCPSQTPTPQEVAFPLE